MMRKIGLLGLGIVAVMSMGAVAASGALAAPNLKAESYPALITGTQTNENVLSNGVRSVTCKGAILSGKKITAASESVEIAPTYSECTGNSSTVAEVVTTGTIFKLTTTTGTFPTGFGFHISVFGHVIINIWASAEAKEKGTLLCKLEVPEEGNATITGGEAMNQGSGTSRNVQLKLNSSNVLIKRVSGTAANCGAAEKTTVTYTGELNGIAKTEAGLRRASGSNRR